MCSSAEKAPRDKRLRRDTGSSDKRTGKLWDTVRTSGQRCQSWQDGCGSWWTSVDLYIKGHRGLRWGKLRRIHCGFFCERNTVSVPRRLNGYKKQGMEKLLWLETAVRECVCKQMVFTHTFTGLQNVCVKSPLVGDRGGKALYKYTLFLTAAVWLKVT